MIRTSFSLFSSSLPATPAVKVKCGALANESLTTCVSKSRMRPRNVAGETFLDMSGYKSTLLSARNCSTIFSNSVFWPKVASSVVVMYLHVSGIGRILSVTCSGLY